MRISDWSSDVCSSDLSFEAYAESKARLFAMQAPSGRAVIATDDDETRRIARNVRAQLTEVSATRRTRSGVQVIDGRHHVDGRILGSQADWPNPQGPANAQNEASYETATARNKADRRGRKQ